jgi:alanyl-tRNA synthetase
MIKFFRRERVKPAIMRVHFAAGKRLMRAMEVMHDTQMGITGMLSCRDVEQVHRVEQLLEDKRMKEKEMKALKDKLSNFHVTEVVNQCVCVSDNDHGNEASLAVVDLGDVDMSYMTMVANAAMEKIDRDGAILVLVGGEDGSDEGSFLLLGNKVVVDQVGKDVAAMFGGRGGGRNGKFQGKGVALRSALGQVKDFVAKAMKAE